MWEIVEFFAVLCLILLLAIYPAVKLQRIICQKKRQIGWLVPICCAAGCIVYCASLVAVLANAFRYVVVLTDQTRHVFASAEKMEAFLASVTAGDVQSVVYPATAQNWMPGAALLLFIMAGGICAVTLTWRIYRKQ